MKRVESIIWEMRCVHCGYKYYITDDLHQMTSIFIPPHEHKVKNGKNKAKSRATSKRRNSSEG